MKARITLALMAACAALDAASPSAWEMTSYADFVQGKLTNLSLGRDGRLALAPALAPLGETGQGAIWAMARAADGSLYAATGHAGRVYRIAPGGAAELIFAAPEPEVFALAVDAQGRVYAATSPNGKIYRIESGRASEYFRPWTRYIWSLAVAADGTLYAGTGEQGRVWRITGAGQGEVYFDSEQSHAISLAIDAKGRLLVGTEPNGILFRVEAKDRAFTLYDSALPEIRAISVQPDGVIYAAAMGGSLVRQTGAGAGAAPAVSSAVTPSTVQATVTVTEEAAQQGQPPQPKPAVQQTQPAQAAEAAAAPLVEYAGAEKSALYRIAPDNTVETVWSSKEENLYDFAVRGGAIYLATDGDGRLYEMERGKRAKLLAQAPGGDLMRLAAAPEGLVAGTSPQGQVFRLAGLAASGEFESPVHDAGNVARWGRIRFLGEICAGCKLAVRTRSGNSVRPDRTWSAWSDPVAMGEDGSPVASPNARYVQWKAEFVPAGGKSPALASVRVAYLPQNLAPEVKSVTVSATQAPLGVKAAAASGAAQPAYSITVTDTGESGASSASGTPAQPVTRAAAEQLQVSWSAEDPDEDKLEYRLEFRAEGANAWTLLRDRLAESSVTLDAEAFADGRYHFRVTASDAPSNPAVFAREAEMESPPVLIDRTPPALTASAAKRTGPKVDIAVTARDGASPLTRCEYSINAGAWRPVLPDDGVIDSREERFTLSAEAPAGAMLVVRAYDSANNAGVLRITLP